MMKNKKNFGLTKVDMSPEAIDGRLRELSQLYKLGIAIQSAKRIGKVKDLRTSRVMSEE